MMEVYDIVIFNDECYNFSAKDNTKSNLELYLNQNQLPLFLQTWYIT